MHNTDIELRYLEEVLGVPQYLRESYMVEQYYLARTFGICKEIEEKYIREDEKHYGSTSIEAEYWSVKRTQSIQESEKIEEKITKVSNKLFENSRRNKK